MQTENSNSNEQTGDPTSGDASHELDQVEVFRTASTQGTFEAQNVKALLESNGIDAFLVGSGQFPNLADSVEVGKHDEARALELIAEAKELGPNAAGEAERETEPE